MKQLTRHVSYSYLLCVCCLAACGARSTSVPGGDKDWGIAPRPRVDSRPIRRPDSRPTPLVDVGPILDGPVADTWGPVPPPPRVYTKELDILFVIDNSGSMGGEQSKLIADFPKLMYSLKSPKYPPGYYPSMHIGVVSTDIGAGPFNLKSCGDRNGDNGLLQNIPKQKGCKVPSAGYISYEDGHTNIVNCGASSEADPTECVSEAFSCIAELGIDGCGFEGPLESARRALDQAPKRVINPGFIRPDAFLAVIFLTDEDDCSAARPGLFDPRRVGLSDPLGPLTSFRCFEFGIQCDVNDRMKIGPRKNCRPGVGDNYKWLYRVEDYINFFKKLKPSSDWIIMSAFAGPTSPVGVITEAGRPALASSCTSETGFAVPAIRLGTVVEAFGGRIHPICDGDFGPALTALGKKISAAMGRR